VLAAPDRIAGPLGGTGVPPEGAPILALPLASRQQIPGATAGASVSSGKLG